jgi:hypothetical protein
MNNKFKETDRLIVTGNTVSNHEFKPNTPVIVIEVDTDIRVGRPDGIAYLCKDLANTKWWVAEEDLMKETPCDTKEQQIAKQREKLQEKTWRAYVAYIEAKDELETFIDNQPKP